MSLPRIAIVAAKRTPIGAFLGSLKDFSAANLGAQVIASALEQAQVAPADVSDVIMGAGSHSWRGAKPGTASVYRCGHPSRCASHDH